MKHVQADSSNFVHCYRSFSGNDENVFAWRSIPGVEQRLEQVGSIATGALTWCTALGHNVVMNSSDGLFLGCIVLASCSVGFIFGRWSNSCSCSTKSTNYESVPGSNAPDEESAELVQSDLSKVA